MEHLLRDIKDQTVSTLAERVSTKLNSLRGLKSRLDEIYQYRKPSLTSAPPSANVCAPGFDGRPNDEASKVNGLLLSLECLPRSTIHSADPHCPAVDSVESGKMPVNHEIAFRELPLSPTRHTISSPSHFFPAPFPWSALLLHSNFNAICYLPWPFPFPGHD